MFEGRGADLLGAHDLEGLCIEVGGEGGTTWRPGKTAISLKLYSFPNVSDGFAKLELVVCDASRGKICVWPLQYPTEELS